MAKATIVYDRPINGKPVNVSSGSVRVQGISYKVKKIKTADFALTKIVESKRSVKVSQDLPFYVRFQNVEIPTYGPYNPAKIGIAIIGNSNYIL
jgi:riboflavin synthase alpha subunit